MIILGVLLLAAAVVAAVELVLANDHQISLHMWRWTWQVDAFWLAVGGAAIIVVALLGMSMLKRGSGRARRLRRERRQLAAENRSLAKRADVAEANVAASADGAPRADVAPARPELIDPAPRDSTGQHAERLS